MEQKTITITIDEFFKKGAVASENFRKIASSKDDSPEGEVAVIMMGLQNMIFMNELAKVLFAENVSSEDTENTENTINA